MSQPSSRFTSRVRSFAFVILGAIALMICATGVIWAWPVPALKVSVETTYITGPLLPDGRPNYTAWWNGQLSAGVTPENNAAVAIAELVFSPKKLAESYGTIYSETIYPKLFASIGMSPRDDSESLVPWHAFAEDFPN